MQTIQQRCEESARNFMQLANLAPTINSAATAIITAIGNGGKVMFCGKRRFRRRQPALGGGV